VNQKYTLGQMMRVVAGASGHGVSVGTVEQIADHMDDWFKRGACDGFSLLPPSVPGGLDPILSQLVPCLQARGLFQTEYVGETLRDHLGLERPKTPSRAH